MSNFFSLGDGGSGSGSGSGRDKEQQNQNQNQNQDQQNNLYLFKNEEISNKSFELWQQYCQLHQQRIQQHNHQTHHLIQDLDFTVGGGGNSSRNSIGHGEEQPLSHNNNRSGSSGFRVMRHGGSTGSGSSGGINCQDCGNQAKKDCPHLRCRTCCKSRGFQCDTHIKSTWVPASKRRERQQQLTSSSSPSLQHHQQHQNQENQHQLRELSLRGEVPKRPRDHQNLGASSSLPCTRLTTTSSGLEVGNFPAELNSPAVFRCVRVSAIDDAEEQFAYQTAVNIGGHVFKGILYDQGLESRFPSGHGHGHGEGSSGSGGAHPHHHQQQPLNLITGVTSTTTTTTATTGMAPIHQGVTMLDPSLYPTPLNAFMAGTQFFPPPRP